MLDEHTADRLLSGVLGPEDAPPGYGGVATLLQAAALPPTQQELARASETVAAMAGAVVVTAPTNGSTAPLVRARRRAGLSRLLRPRIAATLTAGALALFGGLGAAGALPGPLQHAAHVAFGAIGVSVPDSGSDQSSPSTDPSQTTLGPTMSSTVNEPDGRGSHRQLPATTVETPRHGGPIHGPGATEAEHQGGSGGHHHGGANHEGSGPTGTHQGHHHHHHSTEATDDGEGGGRPNGLCNARNRGQGGDHGNKLSASSFRRLHQEASTRGQSVDEYCGGGDEAGNNDDQGENGHKGHHHGDQDSDGSGSGGESASVRADPA